MTATASDLLEAQRRLNLLQQRRKLREENGLAFFKPHPKQERFFAAAEHKRRYARTGNRFGKSEMGAAEDVSWAYGERLFYPEDHPLRTLGIPKRATKGCIVVQDWDKAKEIFTSFSEEGGAVQGKLFRFLPRHAYVKGIRGSSSSGISEIHVRSIYGGVSTINIETVRSFVQNPMGMESSDWDWIHIDEPCPYDMWIALSRGLVDRGGSAWFTCTPITEPWINDMFIPRHLSRSEFNEIVHEKMWMMTGSMYDNPFLDEENIKDFEKSLTDEEKSCRIRGIPLALSGLIYKHFDRDVHLYGHTPFGWESPQKPPRSYTIRVLIDPHPKIPHAALFFATAPTGQTYLFNELFFASAQIADFVALVREIVHGYVLEDILIDPCAFIEDPVNGSCMADEFHDAGLMVMPAVKDLSYGVLRVNDKFRERDDKGNPTIFVHESLERFLFEIDRYIWDPKKERPIDKDDHIMECLYRGVLTDLTYVSPEAHKSNFKPLEVTAQSWHGPDTSRLVRLNAKDALRSIPRKRHNFSQRYPG